MNGTQSAIEEVFALLEIELEFITSEHHSLFTAEERNEMLQRKCEMAYTYNDGRIYELSLYTLVSRWFVLRNLQGLFEVQGLKTALTVVSENPFIPNNMLPSRLAVVITSLSEAQAVHLLTATLKEQENWYVATLRFGERRNDRPAPLMAQVPWGRGLLTVFPAQNALRAKGVTAAEINGQMWVIDVRRDHGKNHGTFMLVRPYQSE